MHHYSQGKPTKQAHKGIPEGQFEEEQGHGGFFGPVSHLIKPEPSTRWVDIQGPLKPRLFDLVPSLKKFNSPWSEYLFNDSVSLGTWSFDTVQTSVAHRNADGDTLFFIHKGKGQVWTEYGLLNYEAGTYVCIPKCLTFYFRAFEATQCVVIQNKNSHFREPDRGMVGRHAVYDIQALGKPNLDLLHHEMGQVDFSVDQVDVKRLNETTKFIYSSNIFDTIGWKGDLFPYTLSMHDMMPLMSHRSHLPPSAHTNFVGRDFVICSFLPRPLEEDEDALKVPFYHQNIDYDEVLFYHDGDFFSRDNLHAGMMTLHPAGFPHGPHPKAVQSVKKKTHTDEYALMLDSKVPLKMAPDLQAMENPNYWKSWME